MNVGKINAIQRKLMLWVLKATKPKCTKPKTIACKIFPFVWPHSFINFFAIKPLNKISSARAVFKMAMISKVVTDCRFRPVARILPATVLGDCIISRTDWLAVNRISSGMEYSKLSTIADLIGAAFGRIKPM